jgi:ABC-type transporter Mla MlaB component
MDARGRATHGAVAEDRRPRTEDSVISLGDSLTLADVGARHAEWKQTLAGGGPIEVDASTLKTVDTAGMQLLAALAREAEARQLPLRWRASTALTESAARLGLKEALRLA